MDEIKAIPRNRYMGMLADGLRKAQDSTGIVGDFLLGDAPRTLDQWSYGFSPVRMGRTDNGLMGAVYGMNVDPGIIDVAGVAGMAPAAGRGAAWAGKQALGHINDAMISPSRNNILAKALSGIQPARMAPGQKMSNDMELWHGGYGPIDEVKDHTGIFDGLFASTSRQSAASHGDDVFKTSIPENKVLRQYDLDYELDHDAVMDALRRVTGRADDDLDEVYRFVVEDGNLFDLDAEDVQRLFGIDDIGEASWEAQRLRGKLARELGYDAVEMADEHGTSYLVLPGVRFSRE